MTKVGILIHCRNLTTIAWEDLIFGQPEHNKLGDLPTLVRALLTLSKDEEAVCIVIGRGPSHRDGLDEAEYTKKFMLDNFSRLGEFSSLQPLLAALNDEEHAALRRKLEDIVFTSEIKNTFQEISEAAAIFAEHDVQKVLQISAASHAPRCLKEQSAARARGVITTQLWQTLATDMCYDGTTPEHVAVIEPLHRLDQPLTQVRPGLSEVIVPYFFMSDDDKKEFITLVDSFMKNHNPLP